MSSNLKSPRREFLKTFTLLTASSALFGKGWLATVVAQVTPGGGVLRLKLSDYPPLQQNGGSVRIGIGKSPLGGPGSCPASVGLFPPVLINRGAGNQFFALDASCPHAGCVVPAYDAGSGFSECPHEGSRFAIDGALLRGPAGFPLRLFTTRFDGVDTISVENSDWNIELTTLGVQSGAGGRFSLRFIAFTDIEYEVRFRESLTGNDSSVSFSLTPGGPADQTFLPGVNDFVIVYVDRVAATGFYSIAMRTREV